MNVEKELPVFAVLDVGTTIDDDGRRWPTAVIDAAAHPEVSDLARVHAVEGIGDITTEAAVVETEAGHMMILSISVTVPVRCVFAVVFSLPQHRELLDDAAVAEQLLIATTDPEAAEVDRPLWLAIDLDPQLLADVLPTP